MDLMKHYYELWTGDDFKVKPNDGFVSYKHAFFYFTRHQLMDWTGVDYLWITVVFLSIFWALILTAPIHWRGTTGEQVMECYISPNLKKQQTHLHLGWPEGECIFSNFWVTYSISSHTCHMTSEDFEYSTQVIWTSFMFQAFSPFRSLTEIVIMNS